MRGGTPPALVAAAVAFASLAGVGAGRATEAPAAAAATDEARLARRGARWRPLIEATADRHGVDPLLVEALVAVESGFNPEAVSAVGAVGLMQLMPQTAVHLGIEDPFEPAANLEAGTRYLAQLLATFDGNRRLAIAAYNAGEGAVRRSGGVPAIPETRRHVWKVERYLAHRSGLALPGAPEGEPPVVLTPTAAPVRLPAPAPLTIRAVRDEHGRLVFRDARPRAGEP